MALKSSVWHNLTWVQIQPLAIDYYISTTFNPKLKLRAKTSLVHTSEFTWLMTCKTFLECYTELKLSANDKVMSHLLILQILTQ